MEEIGSDALRIVQVVTLVSPDGAYGGPVRVAQNQSMELARHGHQVQVFAGVRGEVDQPYFGDGVRSRLFRAIRIIPGTGFAGLAAPAMLPALWQALKGADIVHLHLARDLVMLPAALLCLMRGIPFVVQTHGMIDESDKKLARILDTLVTLRVLRASKRCFWLTPEEQRSLGGLLGARHGTLERLVNGVPRADAAEDKETTSFEFLYLARLHKRKRPSVLVQAATLLSTTTDKPMEVALVGPDEGEEPEVRRQIQALGSSGWIRLEGPLQPSKTLDRMRRASVYVLPSVDEPFPMSVLEAMSVGVPVIVTDSCGLAPFIAESGAGIVCDSSVHSLSAALRRFLEEPGLLASSSAAAIKLTRERFSIDSVTKQLEDVYRDLTKAGSDASPPPAINESRNVATHHKY
ncbi:Glycosyltransferase involved in cell wall bisynthesis [Arthrobacter sp. cf158]|uniref:glycosyltransferase n=1 Tax=Arthrobacter sp. cf158 TaxID=1761744 RepID=UPI0008959B7B|nr:glycosyltransferase [Arthrobacter sp. cf158]SDX02006.1 Glycosyltransferase involved in cell wall bisynthesis [Arthrobacter sp. cf158]